VGPRVQLPQAIAEVFITDQLQSRLGPAPDYLREKLAIQDLANHMTDRPGEILPRLVQLAMELCRADSAGISVLEPEAEQFRWFALKGVLSAFEGATTPRNFSPCGVCLDENGPVLMENPERVYDWIRDANINVPEVLLVPLVVKGRDAIGTLWIVASSTHHFDGEHARLMTELASFVGVALRMVQTEEQLTAALGNQETLTREMSHRVKNLFAITDAMIRMTSRTSSTKEEMTERLSGRVHALAHANALVRRSFGDGAVPGVGLSELIGKVLLPYDHAHCEVFGPDVTLGDQATNNLALVFHELATNAAKYGSLSRATGSVSVRWQIDGGNLLVSWNEIGGPTITVPVQKGFGSTLVETTIVRSGGTIASDWQPEACRCC
jgi:two-component sensor histidine kinase